MAAGCCFFLVAEVADGVWAAGLGVVGLSATSVVTAGTVTADVVVAGIVAPVGLEAGVVAVVVAGPECNCVGTSLLGLACWFWWMTSAVVLNAGGVAAGMVAEEDSTVGGVAAGAVDLMSSIICSWM